MDDIRHGIERIAIELCSCAGLKAGQIVAAGCSTSEITGYRIGTSSNADIGIIIFETMYEVFRSRGIYLAVQCCEHLNRALVVEQETASLWNIVNAVPTAAAGGAFAAAAYNGFKRPACVEEIRADAGLDIGGTLIGMHLKRVAVPVRLSITRIGSAHVTAARTRPPYIGGTRAEYDSNLS